LEFKLFPLEEKMVRIIGAAADQLQVDAYLVGGFVRDRLMNRSTKDMDVVCVGSGISLAETTASLLKPRPLVTTYSRFGTAMLKYEDFEIEFVGARKESYNRESRKPLVEDGTLEDDQIRRDFTINALAVQINQSSFGQLIDPFGGIDHIGIKLIKTPTDPEKTFSDDPLRMMRAIRFATQLGFTIHRDTWEGIVSMAHRIKIISAERVTEELNKIILTDQPSRGFKLLDDCGLLELIFPEFVLLKGIEKRNGKAHKDNFLHTLEVLDNTSRKSQDLWLRWAAILHDIAKPQTKRFEDKIGWTFHGHEVLGAAMVPRIFKTRRLPLDSKMKFVQKMVRLHLRPISLTKEAITDSAIRRLIVDASEDLDHLLLLCEADITSKNHEKRQRYIDNYKIVRAKIAEVEEKDYLRNWQPPIDGELIMTTFNLKPSPVVGQLKNRIREAILDGIISDDFESAHAYMIEQAKNLGISIST
jgi:poly(A) polymerase